MNNTVSISSQRKPAVQGSKSRFTYAVFHYINTDVWLLRSKYCWRHRQQSPNTTSRPSSGLKPKPNKSPTRFPILHENTLQQYLILDAACQNARPYLERSPFVLARHSFSHFWHLNSSPLLPNKTTANPKVWFKNTAKLFTQGRKGTLLKIQVHLYAVKEWSFSAFQTA